MLEQSIRKPWTSAKVALAIVTPALFLTSCGGASGDEKTSDAANSSADESSPTSGSGAEGKSTSSMVNSFAFSAAGATEAHSVPAADQLTLVGGCSPQGPMSIIFMHGVPGDEDYFYFAIESAEPVTSDSAELSEITWDNGAFTPANLPEDSVIKVPNRLTGPGTLTVTSQSGVGLAGRMAGTVEGQVMGGLSAQITSVSASFDVNLSCLG